METLKNAIKIYRGETFTIDKVIKNTDGTPYIIPKLENPYFLLSVSSDRYGRGDKFLRNYWSPVNSPVFENINILKLSDFAPSEAYSDSRYTSFNDVITMPWSCYSIELGEWVEIYADTGVFTDGTSYKYWDTESNSWVDYELRYIQHFTSTDTSEWPIQNCQYSIQLVSGILNRTYLENLCDAYGIEYNSDANYDVTDPVEWANNLYTSDEMLYNLLKEKGYTFDDGYSYSQPVGKIDISIPILNPTDLNITNYMQGGIL